MNEQLVVRNFGPFQTNEEVSVIFRKVTVFIGPTGGGKSTLAKLAAIFRNVKMEHGAVSLDTLSAYSLGTYWNDISQAAWHRKLLTLRPATGAEITDSWEEMREADAHGLQVVKSRDFSLKLSKEKQADYLRLERLRKLCLLLEDEIQQADLPADLDKYLQILDTAPAVHYIPAERAFSSAIEYSKDGLMRDDIGLPKTVLDFNNSLSLAKKALAHGIPTIPIPFLKAEYHHINGQDFIKNPTSEQLFRLHEAASGFQTVTPLLVLLEHLSRSTEQAQSFIIEEPELNLYPTAQQGLLNWLVEKCTKGENDLTITTHSPYILSHLNLLLYAHQVAENHPDRAEDVAKIVPRESWINPKEFAAYHVEGQQENGVRSIVNPETGLISYNGLDALAGSSADEFDQLLDINAGLEVE